MILLLGTWDFQQNWRLLGLTSLQEAGFPRRGDATCRPQVAHRHCQAVTTGLGASAVLSKLGSKQEVILLGVALLALAT